MIPSRRSRIFLERRLAAAALQRFGLAGAPFHLLKYHSTVLFTVQADQCYILRLHPPTRHPFAAVRSELVWLDSLAGHTELRVPEPLPALDGQLLVQVALPGTAEVRYAALLRWVPGRLRERRMTPGEARAIGAALGQLHHYAKSFSPPPGFVRWDCLEDVFGESWDVLQRHGSAYLSPAEMELLHAALQRIDRTIGTLQKIPDQYGLVHGDTSLGNFIHYQGKAAIIDFEVCCFGYYLYDVARAYNGITELGNGRKLAGAFYKAYSAIRPIPVPEDERFIVFRLINMVDIARWFVELPEEYRGERESKLLDVSLEQVGRIMAAGQREIADGRQS